MKSGHELEVRIGIRVTKAERVLLQAIAELRGRSISTVIRRLIRTELSKRKTHLK